MDQNYFVTPFGLGGDRTAIPVPVDPSGYVSFNQGWGVDYQRDQTSDPLAKPIDRASMNYLMYTITQAIKQYQENGIPEWITSANNGGVAFPYTAGTVVKYRATTADAFVLWVATPARASVTTSTSVPGADAQWQRFLFSKAIQAESEAGTDDTVLMTSLQTKYAIAKYIAGINLSQFLPGQIVPFAGTAVPAGVLACNGAAVSRTTYAKLFTAIGTTYGPGDGSTTFNVPNMPAGSSMRVAGTGFTLGAGDNGTVISHTHAPNMTTAGSHVHVVSTNAAGAHTHAASMDQQGYHTHAASSDAQGYHNHTGSTNGVGDHQHNVQNIYVGGSVQGWGSGQLRGPTNQLTDPAGGHAHAFTTDAGGTHSHNIGIAANGTHYHNIGVAGVGDHAHTVNIAAAGDHTHPLTIASTGGTLNIAAGLNINHYIAF